MNRSELSDQFIFENQATFTKIEEIRRGREFDFHSILDSFSEREPKQYRNVTEHLF